MHTYKIKFAHGLSYLEIFVIGKDQAILSKRNLVPVSELMPNLCAKFLSVNEHAFLAVLLKEIVILVLFSEQSVVWRGHRLLVEYNIVGVGLAKSDSILLQGKFTYFICNIGEDK